STTCFPATHSCLTTPANTYIYTLSLHDALPIWALQRGDPLPPGSGSRRDSGPRDDHDVEDGAHGHPVRRRERRGDRRPQEALQTDRKSTRLNSSHVAISYAVFCLKKKNLLNVNA